MTDERSGFRGLSRVVLLVNAALIRFSGIFLMGLVRRGVIGGGYVGGFFLGGNCHGGKRQFSMKAVPDFPE